MGVLTRAGALGEEEEDGVAVVELYWRVVCRPNNFVVFTSFGTFYLFHGTPALDATALLFLGEGFESKSSDARREIVCKAVGSAVKSVKGLGDGASETVVDASTDPHAAGQIYSADWNRGAIYTNAQNLARTLNQPQAAYDDSHLHLLRARLSRFSGIPNVDIIVRDKGRSFKRRTSSYFRGQGYHFRQLRNRLELEVSTNIMRADMGGAAAVVSSLFAIAKLQLPINVVAVTPLCENLPGGPKATKLDDVKSLNARTVLNGDLSEPIHYFLDYTIGVLPTEEEQEWEREENIRQPLRVVQKFQWGQKYQLPDFSPLIMPVKCTRPIDNLNALREIALGTRALADFQSTLAPILYGLHGICNTASMDRATRPSSLHWNLYPLKETRKVVRGDEDVEYDRDTVLDPCEKAREWESRADLDNAAAIFWAVGLGVASFFFFVLGF
ncbi:hypothetical protein DFH29DRAFT_876689 [Suillus ampliporus]|nr:hypothetical protein DFH29DRAFT_876689 [Suillus ampliporus]